jgi:ketosteroid isomerase-like protein
MRIAMNRQCRTGCIAAFATLALTGACAFADGDDALTDLLRRQTDLGSAAGQRGDQATMESFLDPQVLFSGGDGSVGTLGDEPPRDSADEISALIRKQAQAFRDAGQRGDTAAMRRYLDDQVLFTNEDGVVTTRKDFFGGAPIAPPQATSSTVTLGDWVLHHSGDVAFASFVDNQDVRYGSQSLSYKFLSVETWIKRGAEWKLIGSQTIPLYQDPPVAMLPADALNDYVGAYSAGPGSAVAIARNGDGLSISTNGAKATALTAEIRDVFFTPGAPAGYARQRLIFRRNADGKIGQYLFRGLVFARTGSSPAQGAAALPAPVPGPLVLGDFVVHHAGDVAVATFLHDRDTPCYGQVLHQTYRSTETWIRRGAAWKMITSQGRALPPKPPAFALSAAELNNYVGDYVAGTGLTVTISRGESGLVAAASGKNAMPLLAEVRDLFFFSAWPDTSIVFQRDPAGKISGFLNRYEERDLALTKVLPKGKLFPVRVAALTAQK